MTEVLLEMNAGSAVIAETGSPRSRGDFAFAAWDRDGSEH
jgi:hypothetical protein